MERILVTHEIKYIQRNTINSEPDLSVWAREVPKPFGANLSGDDVMLQINSRSDDFLFDSDLAIEREDEGHRHIWDIASSP